MKQFERERRLVELTRRELLQRGALVTGAACTSSLTLSACSEVDAGDRPRRGLAIGPGWEEEPAADQAGGGRGERRHVLSFLDLDSPAGGPRTIPLEFDAHGVIFDPLDPARAMLFEKQGPGSCEVDLVKGAVTRPIESQRQFYGHGAFAPDGSVFYDTETRADEDYRGVIVIRDARTLEEIGSFPSYGAAPHDCRLIDEGRTLVITNGGARRPDGPAPCVTYVDVATHKLVEELSFENPDLTAGHLDLSPQGDLAVASAVRPWLPEESPGAISFRPAGGAFRTMVEPRDVTTRMLGESLSVAVHGPTGTVGVTNPKGNVVTFWSLAEGRFLRALDFAYPRGIGVTLDDALFILSYGHQTSLLYLSPETLEPLAESRVTQTHMGGSHLFLHDLGDRV